MSKNIIFKRYYGGIQTFENLAGGDLLIFVVDDQPSYANLLKSKLEQCSRYVVYAFATGEEALNYMELEPDLVVIDYHLDGVNPKAQKGDVISDKMKGISPNTEIILISSDHKLSFLSAIDETISAVKFKDGYTADVIASKSGKISTDKLKAKTFSSLLMGGMVAFAVVFLISIIFGM